MCRGGAGVGEDVDDVSVRMASLADMGERLSSSSSSDRLMTCSASAAGAVMVERRDRGRLSEGGPR